MGIGTVVYGGDLQSVSTDITPGVSNTVDVGSDTYKMKDGYFAGNLYVDGDVTIGGEVGVANLKATIANDTGAELGKGIAVYIKSTGAGLGLCDADLAAQGECFGVTISTGIANGADASVVYSGVAEDVLTGLGMTPGAAVYVSETAGELTTTPPGDSGDTVFKVGRVSPNGNSLYLEKQFIILLP